MRRRVVRGMPNWAERRLPDVHGDDSILARTAAIFSSDRLGRFLFGRLVLATVPEDKNLSCICLIAFFDGALFTLFFFSPRTLRFHNREGILNVQLNNFSALYWGVLIHGINLLRLTLPTRYVISWSDIAVKSYRVTRWVSLIWPTLYMQKITKTEKSW